MQELHATISDIAVTMEKSAKSAGESYMKAQHYANEADNSREEMDTMMAAMQRINDASTRIGDIISEIESIAAQTNLLSLNASIEAANIGAAGKGFAVVADQIGKLASDSAQSAVNTRELINKTLVEIEKGNTITISTAESFDQIITNMKLFADLAQQSTENANEQASALKQIEEGIEQIAGATQNTATSSEENSAISVNLSDKSIKLDELVKRFKLF